MLVPRTEAKVKDELVGTAFCCQRSRAQGDGIGLAVQAHGPYRVTRIAIRQLSRKCDKMRGVGLASREVKVQGGLYGGVVR